MLAIFKKELALFFKTPSGYIFLSIFLLIDGVFFTMVCLAYQSPNFSGFLQLVSFSFALIAPLLTMRLFPEERRQKTDQMLIVSPISVTDIVGGKAFAAYTIFFASCLAMALYLLPLGLYGFPDWPRIAGAFLGYLLMGGSFISLGVFVSSIAESQISAAILTLCLIFLFLTIETLYPIMPDNLAFGIAFALTLACLLSFWLFKQTASRAAALIAAGILCLAILFSALAKPALYQGFMVKILSWLSLTQRYSSFAMGIIKWDNLVYYLTFSCFFLYLAAWRIEKRRWSED